MNLDSVHQDAFLCSQCRKMCRHICSTHTITRNEADNPSERAILAFDAMERGAFLPEEVSQMYEKCTNCGLCQASCYIDLDVGAIMLAARADIVEQGLAPAPAIAMNENVRQVGNPMGDPAADRFAALAGLIDRLPDRAETLYFAGCQTLYRQPEIAIALARLFESAGLPFTMLREETCCGEPQLLLGFKEDAEWSARQNFRNIAATGAKRVIFTCPSCLRIMKSNREQWGGELGEDVALLHVTEYLAELLRDGKLAFTHEVPLSITYHDPCDLGRRQKIYEAPREILRAIPGITFTEMQFNREFAKCCGAGGALEVTNLKLSVAIAANALRAVTDTGASVLVTACPTCKKSFDRLARRSDSPLETLDILELVCRAMDIPVNV